MLNTRFGVEIEFTGITRREAARIVGMTIDGQVEHIGDGYDTYAIGTQDGRTWKIMRDASIRCQKKVDGHIEEDGYRGYRSCELVTPILTYREDIETLQTIIRNLRKAGAFTNSSCGIHIHLDGKGHDARSIRNFMNIIHAREDLFHRALGINLARERYCKKLEGKLMEKVNAVKPKDMAKLEDLWYDGYWGPRTTHYHDSRYHFLNLHSFFHGHHTVEIRGVQQHHACR
jgi:hypothetical protein